MSKAVREAFGSLKSTIRFLSVALLLGLALVSGFSCAGGGTVGSTGRLLQGEVLDSAGIPLENVTVTADGRASAITDETGMFSLEYEPESTNSTVLEFDRQGIMTQATIVFDTPAPQYSIVEFTVELNTSTNTAAIKDVTVTDARPATPSSDASTPSTSSSASVTSSSSSSSQPAPMPSPSPQEPQATATSAPNPNNPGAAPTRTPTVVGTSTPAPAPTDVPATATPTSTPVPIACRADVDQDGTVELDDLLIVLGTQGLQPGDPGYNPRADVNRDGQIDAADAQLVQDNFNETCPG